MILRPLLVLAFVASAAAAAERRPDIVLILVDDMGYSDIGCYGSEIPTPNLDALAAEGLRFTAFHNTARCCPTRASLLTGLYPHQAGMGHMTGAQNRLGEWYAGNLRAQTVTIAEALHASGYRTYMAGKWHVTSDVRADGDHAEWPKQRGFDRYYGIIGGVANYFAPDTLTRGNTRITAANDREYQPKQYYLTDAIGDQSVRFIDEHCERTPDEPFFLYVAFTAAHWPMQAPEDAIAANAHRYDAGYAAIREARFAAQKRLGVVTPECELSPVAEDWNAVQRKDWEARCMEVYAAMVERMDAQVGAIVAELRKRGRLDDTLLLFLSDNGGCAEATGRKPDAPMPGPQSSFIGYGPGWANVSNTPFRLYKHFTHEGGTATPLIAHWPRRIARHGELERQPGHVIDLMPTCLDAAGATYPAERDGVAMPALEGRSLLPAFAGKPIEREALFWEHEGNRALRVGDTKLVARGPAGAWELYDLAKDPSEMHDLAASEPARVQELAALWLRWAERTHAVPWPWKPPFAGATP